MTLTNDSSNNPIMAIDPGTGKIGIAFVLSDNTVLHKSILSIDEHFNHSLKSLIEKYQPNLIILGNGTGSKFVHKELINATLEKIEIRFINEKSSTEKARRKYLGQFSAVKRFFLIMGYILGTSPMNVDDDVAVLLAEKYLSSS